jgi:hypothetical protein
MKRWWLAGFRRPGYHCAVKTPLPAAVAALLTLSCSAGQRTSTPDTTRSTMAVEEGFQPLPATAWRGYRSEALPAGWREIDGELTRVAAGGDIVTRDTFANFELRLEWKVEPGGNSGIMYRVVEREGQATYHSGPEMQVLDDSGHADGRDPLTSAGALYALYPAPRGVVRRAGEWNEVRLVVNGNHVEHWLNGVKVVEAELWSEDFVRRGRASKFRDWTEFARATRGHIALQDHGDRVAYRNIRIRVLP